MQLVSLADALNELEALTKELGPGVVAFDGDGTLWAGDVADDVVERLLHDKRLKSDAQTHIRHEWAKHFAKPAGSVDPHELTLELLAEDRAGRIGHQRTCEFIGELLAGFNVADFNALCADVFAQKHLRDRLIGEAWAMRKRASELGHKVIVISASPAPIVAAACAVAGMPDVFCGVVVATANGKYLPQVTRPIPYAQGKVQALDAARNGAPVLAAFGDNRFDSDMLNAARLPFAIRPKAALREVAGTVPALRELAALTASA
jgi:phosphatidylglycerophosphatase C